MGLSTIAGTRDWMVRVRARADSAQHRAVQNALPKYCITLQHRHIRRLSLIPSGLGRASRSFPHQRPLNRNSIAEVVCDCVSLLVLLNLSVRLSKVRLRWDLHLSE